VWRHLETGSRQDKTHRNCVCSYNVYTENSQEKTVLSCPRRRCEQAMTERTGVTWTSESVIMWCHATTIHFRSQSIGQMPSSIDPNRYCRGSRVSCRPLGQQSCYWPSIKQTNWRDDCFGASLRPAALSRATALLSHDYQTKFSHSQKSSLSSQNSPLLVSDRPLICLHRNLTTPLKNGFNVISQRYKYFWKAQTHTIADLWHLMTIQS